MASTDLPRTQGLTKWRPTSLAVLTGAGILACCLSAIAQTPCPPPHRPVLVPAVPCCDWNLEVSAEYLLWWTKGMDVPALVTTSPVGTARGQAGVLGLPTTAVLFGDTGLNDDVRSGGRFALDGWFGPCRSLGFELGYAFLEQDGSTYAAASNGNPILARPFANADTHFQDAGLIAYPNVAEGNITIAADTTFGTAEALLVKTLLDECDRHVAIRLGYRYADLGDELTISEVMISRDTATAGTRLDLFDRFQTQNTFHGPQFGLTAQRRMGWWSIELRSSMALGSRHSEVDIQGTTTTQTATTASSTAAGGFLALPTNIGHYEDDAFSGLTELGLKLSCTFACHWRASLGYSFLYWFHVARAGDQIDTTLSAAEFPPGQNTTSPHPQVPFTTTGFWAQGLSFGVEYSF